MNCSICLGTLHQPVTIDCCKNQYCSDCLTEWKQVRNVCPLCCAPTGEEEINKLKKTTPIEPFDDGLLILETEISEIKSRIIYVQSLIRSKRDQFKKFKSIISSSFMSYLQKQLERILIFRDCMEEQFLLMNRVRTVQYIQLIAQVILQVEKSLETNTIYSDQHIDYYDEQEDYYNDYEEQYADYEVHYPKRTPKKTKQKTASNQGNQQQKNKIIKQN